MYKNTCTRIRTSNDVLRSKRRACERERYREEAWYGQNTLESCVIHAYVLFVHLYFYM